MKYTSPDQSYKNLASISTRQDVQEEWPLSCNFLHEAWKDLQESCTWNLARQILYLQANYMYYFCKKVLQGSYKNFAPSCKNFALSCKNLHFLARILHFLAWWHMVIQESGLWRFLQDSCTILLDWSTAMAWVYFNIMAMLILELRRAATYL